MGTATNTHAHQQPGGHGADRGTSWVSIAWLGALLLALLAAILVMTHPQHAREYRLYLTEDRPDIRLRFTDLSQSWTEADLRQRFPMLGFRCYDNQPGEYLDDRSCFADLHSLNGHGAMSLAFYFKDGLLNRAAVNVPWWSHWKALASLEQRHGLPDASQQLPSAGVRLHGWRLIDGGALFFNRDLPLNPLEWSAIFWTSALQCGLKPCFRGRQPA
jgi:hypothetical protein